MQCSGVEILRVNGVDNGPNITHVIVQDNS